MKSKQKAIVTAMYKGKESLKRENIYSLMLTLEFMVYR